MNPERDAASASAPVPVDLSGEGGNHLLFKPDGDVDVVRPDFGHVTKTADGTLLWDPGYDGMLSAAGTMEEDGDHHGERHLDGEEVLYLFAGAMRLSLELGGGSVEVPVKAGQAVAVPRGVWHRLLIDEPAHFLFIGGGRTEIRP